MDNTPKTPETTPLPPDVALIRLARIGADISVATASEAGRTATTRGVSIARWNQIETNRETRNGQTRPAHAKSQTIARMAYGINRAARRIVITPERLGTEGRNPEAATYLTEMLGQEPVAEGGVMAPPVLAAAPPVPPRRFRADPETASAMEPVLLEVWPMVTAAMAANPGRQLEGRMIFTRWAADSGARRNAQVWDTVASIAGDLDATVHLYSYWHVLEQQRDAARAGGAAATGLSHPAYPLGRIGVTSRSHGVTPAA